MVSEVSHLSKTFYKALFGDAFLCGIAINTMLVDKD